MTYCTAQEILLNALWQIGWEGSLGENGYIYMYDWGPLLFTRNYHNIVVVQLLSCLTLQPYGLQHAMLPCPSLSPGVCSNSCPLSWWCHPIISSSVIHLSSCHQSFPASGSFPMSQLFTLGGQSTGASASASVLPVNIQGSFPLGLTGLISCSL